MKDLPLIESGVYSAWVQDLELLAEDPDVEYVSPDREVQGAVEFAVPTVGADIARTYGLQGAGIGVAVIDSGVAKLPDLQSAQSSASRIVYQESFGVSNPWDEYGHGTHVAGIVGGNGAQSTGKMSTKTFAGVAPGVNIVSLWVLNGAGEGTDSSVIAAIDRGIELKALYNIRVMNCRWGGRRLSGMQKTPYAVPWSGPGGPES